MQIEDLWCESSRHRCMNMPSRQRSATKKTRQKNTISTTTHEHKKITNHNNTIGNNLRLLHQPNDGLRSTCSSNATIATTNTASCLLPQRVSQIRIELDWRQLWSPRIFGRPKQIFARSRMPRVNKMKIKCSTDVAKNKKTTNQ